MTHQFKKIKLLKKKKAMEMLNEFQFKNSCLKRHQNSYTHTQIQAMKPYFCGPYNTGGRGHGMVTALQTTCPGRVI